MNTFESWFCGSGLWRWITRQQLLPWLIGESQLGDHLLELGAGPGAATPELRRRVPRVTSLDCSHEFAASLHARTANDGIAVLQASAAQLPFPDRTFSAAIAVLVLHQLTSPQLQDSALSEVLRVLRPGGVFFALEIRDSWFQRVGHIHSTFVPLAPGTVNARLTVAGFWRVTVDFRGSAYRLRALRSWDQ